MGPKTLGIKGQNFENTVKVRENLRNSFENIELQTRYLTIFAVFQTITNAYDYGHTPVRHRSLMVWKRQIIFWVREPLLWVYNSYSFETLPI